MNRPVDVTLLRCPAIDPRNSNVSHHLVPRVVPRTDSRFMACLYCGQPELELRAKAQA